MVYQKKMDNTENMQSMESGESMHETAEAGRGTDTVLGHLSLGEVVIPRAFLDDPQVLQAIQAIFSAAGANLAEFTVGDKANKINPETGHPEFWGGFGGIFKAVTRPITNAVKAVTSIPGANIAIPIAASFLAPGIGTALSGNLGLGLGSLGATALGSGVIGSGLSLASGQNIGQALKSGALSGGLSYGSGMLSSSLGDTALGRGISDLKAGVADTMVGRGISEIGNTASGVFDSAANGVDNLWQGSTAQDLYRSGGDALKSIGINSGGGATTTPIAASGGGASSYGGEGDSGQYKFGGAADSYFEPTTTALNSATSGVNPVASNQYLSPLLSAGLGYNANSNAADALRKQQEANLKVLANARNEATGALTQQQQANLGLLQPYSNGFSFTPGDLTQDPGYQFQLTEGNKAADRANLARGNYFSGEALREAQQFGQGLADNTYSAAFNRALQGRNAGLQGALAQVGVNSNYGQNLANQAINYGNSVTGVNTDIGNIDANRSVNNSNLLSGALANLLGGSSFSNTGALSTAMYSPALEEFLRRNGGGGSYYAR